jgi:hypothetical protein
LERHGQVALSVQPRALSITQGRAVGVAHYLLGGIATTRSFLVILLSKNWSNSYKLIHNTKDSKIIVNQNKQTETKVK